LTDSGFYTDSSDARWYVMYLKKKVGAEEAEEAKKEAKGQKPEIIIIPEKKDV
jgi:hypothetical protein